METVTLRAGETFIRLGQALKKANLAQSGAEAHRLIEEGLVTVNGETELRRGKKLVAGDTFCLADVTVRVSA